VQWKWNSEITCNHVTSPLKRRCLGRDNHPAGDVKEYQELKAEVEVGKAQVRVHQSGQHKLCRWLHIQC
jgi:hypothetical protein